MCTPKPRKSTEGERLGKAADAEEFVPEGSGKIGTEQSFGVLDKENKPRMVGEGKTGRGHVAGEPNVSSCE